MRPDGWEERFLEAVEKHARLPGEYGTSDCFMMAMDVAKAISDKPLKIDFTYTNEIGAARVMKEHNWHNVGDAFANYFGEVAPSFAGRGDIGVVEWDGEICGVVVLGTDVIGKHPVKGMTRVPRMALKRAFRVG